MRNKYPSICYRCSEPVAVGAGHLELILGRFLVQHTHCAIEHRGSDLGKEELVQLRTERLLQRTELLALGTGKKARRARARLKELTT